MTADVKSGAQSLWDRTNSAMEAYVGPWDSQSRGQNGGIGRNKTMKHDGTLTEILFQELYVDSTMLVANA